MKKTLKIAVTGAAGQISYSLLFRIASGEVFGKDYKIQLNLLEIPAMVKASEGVAMELADCAFESLAEVNCFDDPKKAFEGVNWALLVGAQPRGPGMERSDLIKENGPIFTKQGEALNKADSNVRVVVVGNPCNTNCLIALNNCRDIPPENFTAMTALDENRAKSVLATKAGSTVADLKNVIVWGNHSSTMYPDYENALLSGKAVPEVIHDQKWLQNDFLKKVQQRGAEIINARGKSSAASAASACIDHVQRLLTPDAVFSCCVYSDGSFYDIPKGLICSVPIRATGKGHYEIVRGVNLSPFAKEKIKLSVQELLQEREFVKGLLSKN